MSNSFGPFSVLELSARSIPSEVVSLVSALEAAVSAAGGTTALYDLNGDVGGSIRFSGLDLSFAVRTKKGMSYFVAAERAFRSPAGLAKSAKKYLAKCALDFARLEEVAAANRARAEREGRSVG